MVKAGSAFVSVRGEDNLEVGRLPAAEVPLDYPDMPWRADPTTGRASDGRLFSALFERLFISDDQGRSWSPRPIEFDGFSGCSGFGVQPDDTLLLLYSTPAGERGPRGIAVARSADGGESWEAGEPIDISPFTGNPGADGNNICTLPDGTAMVAISHRYGDGIRDHDGAELPFEDKGVMDFVYRSTDGGRTWGDRTLIVKYASESRFLSLGGGRVLAAIRRARWFLRQDDPPELWQRTGGGQDVINKQLYLANSNDGGRTWRDMRQLTTLHGDCPGELVRLSDGRIVAIYNHRYPYGHGDTSALVSSDEGKSWSKERYIVSIGSGYSGSVVLTDDTIVTVCGNTQLNDVGGGGNVHNHNAEPWRAHAVRWRLPG